MSESERPLPERPRGRARRGPQPRTRAERARRRRDRANSGAPDWWPRPLLWLWRWLARPVLRFLEAVVGNL
jgi:hypothetical protein